MATISCIIVPPGGRPYYAIIDDSFSALVEIVKGPVDMHMTESGYTVITNSRGKYFGLEKNRVIADRVVYGPAVITGINVPFPHETASIERMAIFQ